MSVQYRLSWKSIDSAYAAVFEASGRQWEGLTPEEWDALPWDAEETVRVAEGGDIHGQRTTLTNWAKHHHQPIRDVVFEQREIPDDEGWLPVPDLGRTATGDFVREDDPVEWRS